VTGDRGRVLTHLTQPTRDRTQRYQQILTAATLKQPNLVMQANIMLSQQQVDSLSMGAYDATGDILL
jgi:hypothetical protein